jgi:hypothetical protein
LTKPDLNNVNGNFISTAVLSSNWQIEEVADLNEIFRNVLNKYVLDRGIIFRLDKLPLINGNHEYVTCLFDTLMSMVVNHPPVNSKLFLYIKCIPEKVDSDVMDLRVTGGSALYKIEIYSNITTDKNWEMSYQEKLAECSSQATNISGSLSFSPITNTGCLFSLTLPGKIN